MEILTDAHKIEVRLIEYINKYKNISMSVAWASSRSKAYKELIKNKNKLQTSTVGVHFYQTDPKFIENFLNNKKLQFYKKDKGIFHPKIYLFWNNEFDWICLCGSANFTESALSINDEIMILFNLNDNTSFKDAKKIIDDYYNKSTLMTKEMLEKYIVESKSNKKDTKDNFKINKLIKDMNWDEYYFLIKDKGNHLEDRIKLLEKANQYFNNNTFALMSEFERKSIAGGIKNKDGIGDWMLFGRMPIPRFLGRLVKSDSELINISNSLDFINLDEQINENTYNDFLYYFKCSDKDFRDIDSKYKKAGWGYGVSPLSRLIAIKRPDQFFCLTKANEQEVIKNFEIEKEILKEKSYDRYWNEIIQKVRKTKWYNSPKPTNMQELEIWNVRVAIMDAIFYAE
jgi:hypothetical protein